MLDGQLWTFTPHNLSNPLIVHLVLISVMIVLFYLFVFSRKRLTSIFQL